MTDRDIIKAELQNLHKILEAKADMCIGAGKTKMLSFANACSGALELLKERQWISVKDRLPDSNHVLARCEIHGLYKKKEYTCVAFYAQKYSVSLGSCVDGDEYYDYSEKDDEYYLKEGWYEVIRNWDEYGSVAIDDFVTHWMPLPEPPKEGESE